MSCKSSSEFLHSFHSSLGKPQRCQTHLGPQDPEVTPLQLFPRSEDFFCCLWWPSFRSLEQGSRLGIKWNKQFKVVQAFRFGRTPKSNTSASAKFFPRLQGRAARASQKPQCGPGLFIRTGASAQAHQLWQLAAQDIGPGGQCRDL